MMCAREEQMLPVSAAYQVQDALISPEQVSGRKCYKRNKRQELAAVRLD